MAHKINNVDILATFGTGVETATLEQSRNVHDNDRQPSNNVPATASARSAHPPVAQAEKKPSTWLEEPNIQEYLNGVAGSKQASDIAAEFKQRLLRKMSDLSKRTIERHHMTTLVAIREGLQVFGMLGLAEGRDVRPEISLQGAYEDEDVYDAIASMGLIRTDLQTKEAIKHIYEHQHIAKMKEAISLRQVWVAAQEHVPCLDQQAVDSRIELLVEKQTPAAGLVNPRPSTLATDVRAV